MQRSLILSVLFLLPFIQAVAQDYTSSDSRAIRHFEAARSSYNAREDGKALEFLAEAIRSDSQFVEAYLLRANIYTDNKQMEKAISDYRTSIRIAPDFFPNTYYTLGKLEFLYRDYDASYEHLSAFIEKPKANPSMVANAKRIMSSCRFAQQAVKHPVPFNPVNMGEGVNTEAAEYFPAITADGSTFLFTRRIKSSGVGQRAMDQEDFYVSTRSGSEWQKATPLVEINTVGNEGAPTLSADGQYLFFTACEELYSSNDARPTKGSCDLFITKKVGDRFGKARNLEEPVNSGAWESQPSFSSDGRTLYFVRAIKGADGRTQRDIFMTRINDNSSWSDPQPLGKTINTQYDEMSVFIHPDDQTLYFSSDGHPGMGGQDIFVCRRLPTGEWGEPVNLGYPINTEADENSLLVSPDGKIGFFSSDRTGGYGSLDLYRFDLDESLRPKVVTYMKGKVFDVETTKPLAASFELIDLDSRRSVVNSTSNPGNGEYLVCLPTGRRYALNVSKDGYLFYSENFELKDAAHSDKPVVRDVPMKPIRVGESVVLKNIFFEFDKYDLKEESKAELGKILGFLSKNPRVKVEIGGHTDNVGSKTYNLQLSEKRAQAVKDYLVASGVSAARLTSAGYGDAKPIADNSTEQGRAMNRRTEFKLVSVE